ncbi:MAG: Phosphate ABC transporter, substrate-binding protein PstS (TC 3.A.1.7.1) [Olavius algarvensis Gamma 1 endosymbiont]|nr:MAG: Phosphate ABC transporter, substrate-binding protein PstS (TC 3.A.1.7.1) [Olavius algarvensis Gamma 1 endosymbiont]
MSWLKDWCAALAVCGAVWSGLGMPQAVAGQVRVLATGSSTVAPVVAELARRYEEAHPDVRIDVQTGGSSRGVSDVYNGLSHIGMVSRALKPGERGLHAYTIARDGIAVITHRDNPVTAIDKAGLQRIYRGEARDWGAVGGRIGAPIVVVNKSAAHSTLELFLDYLGLAPDAVEADIIVGDNQQGIKTVAGNPLAIGYVSIGAALQAQDEGTPIVLMTLDGVAPTVAHIRGGGYPITRPLNVVTREPATGVVGKLLEFARGDEGAAVIESLSFVPVR